MELRQLEYFREIAETGRINEAARRLNMSQPPLSYQLRQLEDELKVQLFVRSSQGVTLTDAGRILYRRAGELLSYADSTRLEVSSVGKKRVLRLGITSTTVTTIMPHISRFAKISPDVNFEVHDGTTFSLFNSLLDGIIDVSVVRTPLRLDEVEHARLRTEPMIAVSAPGELEGCTEMTLPYLAKRPLIIYRRYEKLIMDAFHARGLEPDIFCICDDARGAVLWVREGLATAIFPASMSELCAGLEIKTIAERTLETEILLIWRKGHKSLSVVQEFLDVCLS